MQLIQLALSLLPKAIEAAQQGVAAWHAYLDAQKIQGNEDLNTAIEALKSEFTRHRIIAEHEAGLA